MVGDTYYKYLLIIASLFYGLKEPIIYPVMVTGVSIFPNIGTSFQSYCSERTCHLDSFGEGNGHGTLGHRRS